MRSLTGLTAEPALRLLLGEAGFEPAEFPFREAWAVFAVYLQWPAVSPDEASFQVSHEATDDDAPITVSFVRQLTAGDDSVGYWQRAIILEFTYPPSALPVTACELWRSECATLADFVAAVEARPEFQKAAATPPLQSGLYQQTNKVSDAGAA